MSETPQGPPARGGSVRVLVLVGLLLLLGAGGAWYLVRLWRPAAPAQRTEPAPPDPRLAYTGPFLNIAPDVKYVGSAACGSGCHDAKLASYREHPMGRSLFAVAGRDPAIPEDQAHNNPFHALGSQFRVERAGDTVRHRRFARDEAGHTIYDTAFDVAYAIGSGAHGHSYLAVREGGYVVQTPISWYAQKQIWNLSPGFNAVTATGREVKAECLFCHANHSRPIEGTINRYQEPLFDGLAIGCERCHGPGEKHVAARSRKEPIAGDIDTTIVNPAHLEPSLREAVCEQCHLVGEVRVLRRGRQFDEFRPGLPVQDIITTLVRVREGVKDNKAVNHVEQMHVSRCFQATAGEGQLGCISCHDPHVHVIEPAQRIAHYRASCLACHEQRGCSLPHEERVQTSPEDSCIDCHMPRRRLGNIPHTASTDHCIVRFRPREEEPFGMRPPSGPGIPLRPFHAPTDRPLSPELERDLGVGLMELRRLTDLNMQPYSGKALAWLDAAVDRDPDDWDAWEAKADALYLQSRPSEALAALQTVLAKAPGRETALLRAASAAQDLGQRDLAIDYWRRTVEVNPWGLTYRRSLCILLANKGAWAEYRPQAEAWLRLDPASIDARRSWVSYLLRTGQKEEARAEFAKIRALHPPNLRTLQAWFDDETR